MKATGIVRRIDSLGRIVIPKELFRTIKFNNNDPMEIYINDKGYIVLKKYEEQFDVIGQLDTLESFVKNDGEFGQKKSAKVIELINEIKKAIDTDEDDIK